MLSLKNIVKEYTTGDTTVAALKGVSIDFRTHEFVSILGHSGCGKTTMLNIIGGLDQYTTGDLVIRGKSTKEFKDADWDAYRNHSVGFVFQSYNLIPHQTVLANVELALTLSGVSKAERRRRATEALTKVGLADQLNKKPNQMSGGQMQRVAIARALVNDPDILLADEPTGALDSATSVQIMDILKEISKDKLIIMVTHNPELAELYSSRIVRLQDGLIVSDSQPYDASSDKQSEVAQSPVEVPQKDKKAKSKRVKNKSMSFGTALSLSLNNLMTKKGRTFLTSFAGSIGIIGIALILALSNGIQLYINRVQEDTLSSYPLMIEKATVDMTSMMMSMMEVQENQQEHELDAVYSNAILFEMMNTMVSEIKLNDLASFKTFIESGDSNIKDYLNAVQYTYGVPITVYNSNTDSGLLKVNPSEIFNEMMQMMGMGDMSSSSMGMSASFNIWSEMLDNEELMQSQYDLIEGKWPTAYNELVLVVDEKNEVSDMALYSLGLKDSEELMEMMSAIMNGETVETTSAVYSYDEILQKTFRAVVPAEAYVKQADGSWLYQGENETFMKNLVNNGIELKIVGILRPNEDAVATSIAGNVGYLSSLTEEMINRTNNAPIVIAQRASEHIDVATGLEFDVGQYKNLSDAQKAGYFDEYVQTLTTAEKAELMLKIVTSIPADELEAQTNALVANMTRDELLAFLNENMASEALMKAIGLAMFNANLEQNPEYADQLAGLTDEEKLAMMAGQGVLNDFEMIGGFLSSLDDEALRSFAKVVYAEKMVNDSAAMIPDEYANLTEEELAARFDESYTAKTEAEKAVFYDNYMPVRVIDSSYDEALLALGAADLSSPTSINLYAKDFDAKEEIEKIIASYNEGKSEAEQISYTDYVGLLMSSVSTIVDFVSYALIAFVSISLVVSSIMIGIITYISVLERTKEIGILRAIGASKKDVSRVFNAETLIVGFAAGAIGIIVSLLLCIPINLIISALADVNNIASLPWQGALILVLLSVLLTTVAGLVPSRMAAKKDPVIALRSE